MNILLDSFVFMEIFKGTRLGKKFLEFLHGKVLFTAITNLFEVYYRTIEIYGFGKADEYFRYVTQNSRIINLDEAVVREAGEIKIKENLHAMDALTLACARLNNLQVLSGDAHLKGKKNVIYLV